MKDCGFQFDNSYFRLPEIFYTRLAPQPVSAPKLIFLNQDLASTLGLDFSRLSISEQAALFSGNAPLPQTQSFSQAYAGHQFGHFTILGDGRANILGEHITPDNQRFDIQFKGSGHTPYSRGGDGRAPFGAIIREYIISEAMYALGIPTTRSLAVVTMGDYVVRDTLLLGAVLTRIASSHIRVGTFEFAASKRDNVLMESLLDYTIDRHDPELKKSQNAALAFLKNVMARQSDLIVHWMRVGFIHGVMNTDNVLISGETIDYGPCAFMDEFNPNQVFSSIDTLGRYAYVNQPLVTQWNIARFAETLLPLIDQDPKKAIDIAEEVIQEFEDIYQDKWLSMMRSKLGLFGVEIGDAQLISDLLKWMQDNHADYTNTFRQLSDADYPIGQLYTQNQFKEWYSRWQQRLAQNDKPLTTAVTLMKATNPAVIPRNHQLQQAIEAAYAGNLKVAEQLIAVLKAPYSDNHQLLKHYQAGPTSAQRVYQTFCGT